MIVGFKDILKMIGIFILSCCAVFVCTLFLNYNIDLAGIKDLVTTPVTKAFYDAQVSTGKMVSILSGGCLSATSVVMLFFYIKHYIDTHRKELGILKALGYSNMKIARSFWTFGASIFIGTLAGYLLSNCIMPIFYKVQNEDAILPEITIGFHPVLIVTLILLPTVLFSILSIFYGYFKLTSPVLDLLRGKTKVKVKQTKKESNLPFLQELRKNTVRQRTSLVFFITFATFCYSSMIQMSFGMKQVSSVMFSVIMFTIGIALACVLLFLATSTVVHSNTKNIAMMRVFGYPLKECSRAILGGYRPWAYIGFLVGTGYQYMLIKTTMTVIFKDYPDLPEYNFDLSAFLITLGSFLFLYELIMYGYSRQIKKISIKEIMLE